MPDPNSPESQPVADTEESFGDVFSQYERDHKPKSPAESGQAREGTVIAVSADSVFLDIGYKTEGILPLTAFQNERQPPKPGDKMRVTVKGRDPEGYYELTRGKIERPTDWPSLEKAFNEKSTIVGTVTAVVKGGLSVDVGVRAFMPASRSGVRDAAEMEKLVGQEIRCRITKLDVDDEDVVVDRRIIAEEEATAAKQRRYAEMKEGDTVRGAVRSLTDYGAFVDIGDVDALLHVGEISWTRVNKPADVLNVGDQIDAKILKIDSGKRRISISMKQLQPHPWDSVAQKYNTGERVRGTVTRLMDFGAFVEIEPGIEGLIHISEMSWGKKVRTPNDAAGTIIEGPITSITKFGAFVQLAEGIDGMVPVSEISAEKRINRPQDVVKVGQVVQALVLSIDEEKRNIRLSMKHLVPTGLDEYISEHKVGDVVTGRVLEIAGTDGRAELGEGIQAKCRIKAVSGNSKEPASAENRSKKADLSSLGSMLQARWKSGAPASEAKPEQVAAGQIRQFRITQLDVSAKKIEVELV